jgi:hypothetical protein
MTDQIVTYIKGCVFLLLGGRGVLHFTTDVPYDYLFGKDEVLSIAFGILLIGFAFLAVLPNIVLRRSKIVYIFAIPSVILLMQSCGSFVKADYVPEQIVEHALQIALPILLIYVCKGHFRLSQLYYVLTTFVALTFIGHAMFALGFHYLPDNFVEMTTQSLLISESSAVQFLFIIGWLDIVFALGAFVPNVRKYSVWYLIVWGFLTSMARVYFVLGEGISAELFLVNFPNMIYRLPHGIIPVLMMILIFKLEFRSKERPVFMGR